MAIAAALMAFTAFAPMNIAHAEEAKPVRSISISGHGETRAVPDLASISMGVTTQGATAREALDANTKAMAALMESLKAAGIEAKDIATSNFSVGPRYDYGQNNNQPPKVVGYDVNNMVTAIIRKVDSLGAVLDGAVSSGSNTVNGISFAVSKPETMLDEARKLAVADARRKAEVYAAAAGFTLGEVISLSEGQGYMPPPAPMVMKAAAADAGGAVPVAQGEQALTVDVNIVWAVK